MKKLTTIATLLIISLIACGQENYFTRSGQVAFFSSTPVEDIKAINKGAVCVLDITNGNIEVSMLNQSFQFKKALMQEHFNENYMESNTYPKSKFKGQIKNMSALNLKKSGVQKVFVKGELTIHGKTQTIDVPGTIEPMDGNILARTTFKVTPEDYGITIPGMVRDNIAKEIEVTIDLNLEPLKK